MPNAEAAAVITAPPTRRSDESLPTPGGTQTCERISRLHGEIDASLSLQAELLVSIGSTRLGNWPVRFSLTGQRSTTTVRIGALACHLAIKCGLGLHAEREGPQNRGRHAINVVTVLTGPDEQSRRRS